MVRDRATIGTPAATVTIGLDLHKRESQLCILAEDGVITERRIATARERLTAVPGRRPPAHVVLEASTESEWVARHREALGHSVVVANPTFAPMSATYARPVKTNERCAGSTAPTSAAASRNRGCHQANTGVTVGVGGYLL